MGIRMTERELQDLLKTGKIRTETPISTEKKKRKGKSKDEFQSYAEQRYWETVLYPMHLAGLIRSCDLHRYFNLRAKVYTPDFFLEMTDGSVRVIEIKGKVIRKLQRDYPLRRQLFILNYCIPNNWEFEEVSSEELTKR